MWWVCVFLYLCVCHGTNVMHPTTLATPRGQRTKREEQNKASNSVHACKNTHVDMLTYSRVNAYKIICRHAAADIYKRSSTPLHISKKNNVAQSLSFSA